VARDDTCALARRLDGLVFGVVSRVDVPPNCAIAAQRGGETLDRGALLAARMEGGDADIVHGRDHVFARSYEFELTPLDLRDVSEVVNDPDGGGGDAESEAGSDSEFEAGGDAGAAPEFGTPEQRHLVDVVTARAAVAVRARRRRPLRGISTRQRVFHRGPIQFRDVGFVPGRGAIVVGMAEQPSRDALSKAGTETGETKDGGDADAEPADVKPMKLIWWCVCDVQLVVLAALAQTMTARSARELSALLVHPRHGDMLTAVARVCVLRGERLADVLCDLRDSRARHTSHGARLRIGRTERTVDWEGWHLGEFQGNVVDFALNVAVLLNEPPIAEVAIAELGFA
jgi:hypothetical protein